MQEMPKTANQDWAEVASSGPDLNANVCKCGTEKGF